MGRLRRLGLAANAGGTVFANTSLLATARNRDPTLNTPKTLNVYIAGAEAGVLTRVAAMLEEQRTRLHTCWQLADEASADLLVIESDSLYGHMDWLKACATGLLVASWSSAPETDDLQLRLRNPITADGLVALLNRADSQLNGAPGASENPIHALPPNAEADVSEQASEIAAPMAADVPRPLPAHPAVSPHESVVVAVHAVKPVAARSCGIYLLDLLETDSPLKGHLRLAAEGLPTLLLDPHHRTWHTESTLKTLSPWCTRSLSSLDVTSVDDTDFPTSVAQMRGHPYSRLKWLAHLTSGHGRLDPGLDVNARYKLARWPQSERDFPKHFRIATIMLKEASTLDEIATYAGTTIGDAADFINGYHAIGYIEQTENEAAQEDTRRSGLFSRNRKVSAS